MAIRGTDLISGLKTHLGVCFKCISNPSKKSYPITSHLAFSSFPTLQKQSFIDSKALLHYKGRHYLYFSKAPINKGN